jgi:hypothetical protein
MFEFICLYFQRENRHGKFIIPEFEEIEKDILNLPESKKYYIDDWKKEYNGIRKIYEEMNEEMKKEK